MMIKTGAWQVVVSILGLHNSCPQFLAQNLTKLLNNYYTEMNMLFRPGLHS